MQTLLKRLIKTFELKTGPGKYFYFGQINYENNCLKISDAKEELS